jgi:cell division protein DivIC
MDFKKKQKTEASLKDFFLRAGAILIMFVLVFLVVADVKIYQKRKGLQAEVAKYEQQIKEIKEKNKELEERISNSDNPDYIEKVAREEQDMQKPGENVVSFVMPEEKPQNEKSETTANDWFDKLANLIKSLF